MKIINEYLDPNDIPGFFQNFLMRCGYYEVDEEEESFSNSEAPVSEDKEPSNKGDSLHEQENTLEDAIEEV